MANQTQDARDRAQFLLPDAAAITRDTADMLRDALVAVSSYRGATIRQQLASDQVQSILVASRCGMQAAGNLAAIVADGYEPRTPDDLLATIADSSRDAQTHLSILRDILSR